jgi:hypothetical protein
MSGSTSNQQQIQDIVTNSFEYVTVINNKITEQKTEQSIEIVSTKVNFLQNVLFKKWFTDNITTQQYNDIKNCILSGITYCS